MDYETKANLTTLFSVYLLPVLLGVGVSLETSQAIIGLIVVVLPVLFGMLNEMYTSKHLTRDNPSVTPVVEADIVKDVSQTEVVKDNVSQKSESLGFDGDLVSVSEL